jgi:hypothetical protein
VSCSSKNVPAIEDVRGRLIISKLLYGQPAKISAAAKVSNTGGGKNSAIVNGSETLATFIEDSRVIRVSNYS